MAYPTMPPMTDGTLTIAVKDATGAAVTTAVVLATLYNPNRQAVATAQPMTHLALGVYALDVPKAWTTSTGGKPVQGEYTAEIVATYDGNETRDRFAFVVAFTN
jgi:hypothetical protein